MSKLQIAYVLCTDRTDYLHHLAASTALTRTTLPACEMVCVMDRRTRRLARASGIRLQDWVDHIILVKTPHRDPLLRSRYLKTTLRSHLEGDYLYLDIDAIVVDPGLAEKLECSCIAASQNRDHVDRTGEFPPHIGNSIYRPMGWEHPFLPYVNSGVMYCRDTPECHALYRRWHELWNEQVKRTKRHLDQPALNRAIRESPGSLRLMPPEFNPPVDVGPEFETGAWVYHYYLSVHSGTPRPDSLLGMASNAIRHSGKVSPRLLRRALSRKQAFPSAADQPLPALCQGWWSHAFYLFRDSMLERWTGRAGKAVVPPFPNQAVAHPQEFT